MGKSDFNCRRICSLHECTQTAAAADVARPPPSEALGLTLKDNLSPHLPHHPQRRPHEPVIVIEP